MIREPQPGRSAEPDPQQEGPSSPHRRCDRGTAAEQACFDHARAGDDCVYHFAPDALMKAVEESEDEDAQDLLKIMGDKQTAEGYFGPGARSRSLRAFAWA